MGYTEIGCWIDLYFCNTKSWIISLVINPPSRLEDLRARGRLQLQGLTTQCITRECNEQVVFTHSEIIWGSLRLCYPFFHIAGRVSPCIVNYLFTLPQAMLHPPNFIWKSSSDWPWSLSQVMTSSCWPIYKKNDKKRFSESVAQV